MRTRAVFYQAAAMGRLFPEISFLPQPALERRCPNRASATVRIAAAIRCAETATPIENSRIVTDNR